MPSVVDVDEPATWPAPIAEWVDEWAERRRGSTEYTCDLRLHDQEAEFLDLFDGYLVRTYHCTRLLNHERTMILEQGLRPLSAELVMERIHRAHEAGAISDAERATYESGHQFVAKGWEERVRCTEKQVCLLISREIFDHMAHGCEPLLSTWGGEAIYFPIEANKEHSERLRLIGRPSIVVSDLDLSVNVYGKHHISAGLSVAFVGKKLDLLAQGVEIFYKAPVPAENIAAIWHPGDPGYDRHKKLPRS
jgi:hypothetical protein